MYKNTLSIIQCIISRACMHCWQWNKKEKVKMPCIFLELFNIAVGILHTS